MAHIIRVEIAIEAREALKQCLAQMKELNEPCDHDVGICWCDYHHVMDHAGEVIKNLDTALGERDMTIDENDPIYKAIDIGGGHSCDIEGVVCELDKAGFVIVPKEPTREMWAAGGDACVTKVNVHHDKVVGDVWNAMVKAAPK